MKLHLVVLAGVAGLTCALMFSVFATPTILEARPLGQAAEYQITAPDGGAVHVRRGDPLHAVFRYCKYDDLPVTVNAWIEVSHALYEIVPEWQRLPVGCHTMSLGFARVPASLPIESTASWARLRVKHTYRVNLIREVTYDFVSDYFWIEL